MTNDTQPTGTDQTSTWDWVKAALFIAIIVVVVVLVFLVGTGQFWGCGAYTC